MKWADSQDDSLTFSLCLVGLFYGGVIVTAVVTNLWPRQKILAPVRKETPPILWVAGFSSSESKPSLALLPDRSEHPPIPEPKETPLPELITLPPDPEADRMTRFGKAGGTGQASQEAKGDKLQLARLADLEQAMLSRDNEGPGPRADRPDQTTTTPGAGGTGRRAQPTIADLARLLDQSGPDQPFGVAPPPTAPRIMARVPAPPADIAPPPLPTALEHRPVIAIQELPGVAPRESDQPASRPSDRAVAKTQDQAPTTPPDLTGSAATRPAVVYAKNFPETRPPDGLKGEAAALPTTRPDPMLLPGADPLAQASQRNDKARPATREAHGIAFADAKAIRPELPDGPLNTNAKPAPKGPRGEQVIGRPSQGATSGAAGNPAEAADPAPKSDSESDAFSKTGSVEIVAGRVEARLGREVKTIAPRLRLKGQLDAGTSLFRPIMVASVRIEEDGSVSDVSVLRSSGSREIDVPTTLALYQWRFEPRRNADGDPVPDAMVITIRFY